jgi:acetyl esterase
MSDERRFADPQIAEYVRSPASVPDYSDIPAARRIREDAALLKPREPNLARVTDLEFAGLHARLYRPSLEATPLLLFLHGGGWIIGSIETYDHIARRLAHLSGVSVLSLGYRLAPEHPWPAAIDDAVAALEWLADRDESLGAFTTLAVGGDSAGGYIATQACHRLRDTNPTLLPALQVLLYPITDLTGSQPSMRENATGCGLTAERVEFFARHWVADPARWSDPDVSPLHAQDLSGLPPALVVVADYDPLRDEGARYAERMAEADVEVTFRCEPGLIHAFLWLDELSPACAAAGVRVSDDLHRLLSPSKT